MYHCIALAGEKEKNKINGKDFAVKETELGRSSFLRWVKERLLWGMLTREW